jgi:hypothetical protein
MEMKNDLYRVGSSMFGNYVDAALEELEEQ